MVFRLLARTCGLRLLMMLTVLVMMVVVVLVVVRLMMLIMMRAVLLVLVVWWRLWRGLKITWGRLVVLELRRVMLMMMLVLLLKMRWDGLGGWRLILLTMERSGLAAGYISHRDDISGSGLIFSLHEILDELRSRRNRSYC